MSKLIPFIISSFVQSIIVTFLFGLFYNPIAFNVPIFIVIWAIAFYFEIEVMNLDKENSFGYKLLKLSERNKNEKDQDS